MTDRQVHHQLDRSSEGWDEPAIKNLCSKQLGDSSGPASDRLYVLPNEQLQIVMTESTTDSS